MLKLKLTYVVRREEKMICGMWPSANVRNQMTVYIIWLHEIPLKKYLYIYEWPNTVSGFMNKVQTKFEFCAFIVFHIFCTQQRKKYFYCYMQDFILQSKTYFKERTFIS